jgi:hypothetical protein
MIKEDEYEVETKVVKKKKLSLVCDRCGCVLGDCVLDKDDTKGQEILEEHFKSQYGLTLKCYRPGYLGNIQVERLYIMCANCREEVVDIVDLEIKSQAEKRPSVAYIFRHDIESSWFGRLWMWIARKLSGI